MRSWRSWSAAAGAAVLVVSLLPAAVSAQGDVGAISVVEGSCAAPGASVVTLTSAAGGTTVGPAEAVPVTSASGSVALSLTALVAAPHAVVVNGGADAGAVVACGDVGGSLAGGTDLAFGVAPVAGSGIAGVGRLRAESTDSTAVTVDLVAVPAAGPGAQPSPAAGAATIELAGDLFFAGWSIKVSSVEMDPATASLRIKGTYENHAAQPMSLLVIEQDGGVRLDWNGTVVEVHFEDPVSVPANGTIAATLVNRYPLPEGFDPGDAVLTFGQPTQQQATLPLVAGASGTSALPQPVAFKKKVKVKPSETVVISGVQVVAAGCGGPMDLLYFTTTPKDSVSVLVDVRIQAGRKDNVAASSTLTGPDGLTVLGAPGGTGIGAGDSITGTLCFTVADYTPGTYTLTLESGAGKSKVKLDLP